MIRGGIGLALMVMRHIEERGHVFLQPRNRDVGPDDVPGEAARPCLSKGCGAPACREYRRIMRRKLA